MTHPDSWHFVRPLGQPTLSVMVTGRPWGRESHKSDKPLLPLSPTAVVELLELFRARYPSVRPTAAAPANSAATPAS